MEKITSLNNEYIKYLASLNSKKERLKNKEFIVEGYHLVEEAHLLNRLKVVLSSNEESLKEFNNIRCILVNEAIIKKISTTVNPQDIVGIVSIQDNNIDLSDKKFIVLDNIQDPGNLGTIIRTSIALGVKNILLSNDSVDVYNEKVIRSSQGTFFKANIYIDKLANIYQLLKENNIKIYITEVKDGLPLNNFKGLDSFALVMGNEANGVSNITKEMKDYSITIKMRNSVESLNVSQAFSIILYNLLNK